METWGKVVWVLFVVTGGLVIYADWTDDVGAETLAYIMAALALLTHGVSVCGRGYRRSGGE